ncbi:MAG: hypothetical protein R3A79_30085 [Nannocystaceae bacterium]
MRTNHRSRTLHLALLAPLTLALACAGDDGEATTTQTTSAGASASSTSGKTTTAGSTTANLSGTDATTDGTGTSTTDATTTDATTDTTDTTDTGVFPEWCNYWDMLCPEGTKCAFDGDVSSVQCVAVDRRPKGEGEACTREGGQFDGVDDCGDGLLCWGGAGNEGTCVPFCAEGSPYCSDAYECAWCQDCALGICMPLCNPLDAEACPEGTLCVPNNGALSCVNDGGGEMPGAYGDPCEFLNVCDPGLFCADASYVPKCQGAGCCASFCDLSDPQCPDLPDVTCLAFWEDENEAPPGLENLGVCVVPPP